LISETQNLIEKNRFSNFTEEQYESIIEFLKCDIDNVYHKIRRFRNLIKNETQDEIYCP
jgi:hypothetical protein